MDILKLGLKPVIPRKTDLMFSRYRTPAPLPAHPLTFGHEAMVDPAAWGMLGNDKAGCCVWSGAAHEHILWNAIWKRSVRFSEKSVLSDYSASTGYDASQTQSDGSNPTDNGTDVHQALAYRQNTGILDDDGNRHKTGAFVWLEPGNWEQYLEALWLFDSLSVCFNLPQSAMDQFRAGFTWNPVPFSPIIGGHYVPGVANRANSICVTWAQAQMFSPRFYKTFNSATAAIISPEQLDIASKKNAQSFDYTTLSRDLAIVQSEPS